MDPRRPAHGYAQTIIQLLNQLREAGWADADLESVRRAYGLGLRLFPASFRANGKPFLAHLVGTASVLGAVGASPAVVRAGLLHAAYSHGDFGDGASGATAPRRAELRAAAGEEAEELIAGYSEMSWDRVLPSLEEGAPALVGRERDRLLMRLANELDDLLDEGMAYSGKRDVDAPLAARVAERMDLPTLAGELRAWGERNAGAELPDGLRSAATASFRVPPRSYARRLRPLLASRVRRAARRLRRGGGR